MKRKKKSNTWIIVLVVVLAAIGLMILLSAITFAALLFYITSTNSEQTGSNHGQIPVNDEVVRVIREDSSQNLMACTPSQRQIDICTAQYEPVCGYKDFPENCNSETCAETFSNSCNACSNTETLYYTKGPCLSTST